MINPAVWLANYRDQRHHAPIGRLIYRYGGVLAPRDWSTSSMATWLAAVRARGEEHPVFEAGLFDSSLEQFENVVEREADIRQAGQSSQW
jgi:hypothetical protein